MPSAGDESAPEEFAATIRRIVAAAPRFARESSQGAIWQGEEVDPESRLFLLLMDAWAWLSETDADREGAALGAELARLARRGVDDPAGRLLANSFPHRGSIAVLDGRVPRELVEFLRAEEALLGEPPRRRRRWGRRRTDRR